MCQDAAEIEDILTLLLSEKYQYHSTIGKNLLRFLDVPSLVNCMVANPKCYFIIQKYQKPLEKIASFYWWENSLDWVWKTSRDVSNDVIKFAQDLIDLHNQFKSIMVPANNVTYRLYRLCRDLMSVFIRIELCSIIYFSAPISQSKARYRHKFKMLPLFKEFLNYIQASGPDFYQKEAYYRPTGIHQEAYDKLISHLKTISRRFWRQAWKSKSTKTFETIIKRYHNTTNMFSNSASLDYGVMAWAISQGKKDLVLKLLKHPVFGRKTSFVGDAKFWSTLDNRKFFDIFLHHFCGESKAFVIQQLIVNGVDYGLCVIDRGEEKFRKTFNYLNHNYLEGKLTSDDEDNLLEAIKTNSQMWPDLGIPRNLEIPRAFHQNFRFIPASGSEDLRADVEVKFENELNEFEMKKYDEIFTAIRAKILPMIHGCLTGFGLPYWIKNQAIIMIYYCVICCYVESSYDQDYCLIFCLIKRAFRNYFNGSIYQALIDMSVTKKNEAQAKSQWSLYSKAEAVERFLCNNNINSFLDEMNT